MAVVDQLKSFFRKKTRDAEQDSRLSLGMPDVSTYPSEVGADFKSGLTQYGVQEEVVAPVGSEKPATDLIALPVLGKKTIAQHRVFCRLHSLCRWCCWRL